MKKYLSAIIIFLIMSVVSSPVLQGAPIDTAVAKRVALHFYQSKTDNAAYRSLQPVLVYTGKDHAGFNKGLVNTLYIYNVGDGFVILSADDRVKPVLAYSTQSAFDTTHMPEALRDWLEETRQQVCSVISTVKSSVPANQASWTSLYQTVPTQSRAVVVAPLLSTTWNQNAYYNNACPADSLGPNGHVYAGCVATMMAQVIRYWQYPSHGLGSKSYTLMKYGTLAVNFGNTQYRYNLMPNQISSSSASNQINEVSKLIYHCAVSVSMQFGPGVSGAALEDVNGSLQNYFGYSPGTFRKRSDYADSAWISMMKAELDLLHPIMYRGNGPNGGHAFVCDGYDSDGLFHFNWGWGGFDDGYFNINSLVTTHYTFNSNHAMLVGIQADTPMLKTNCSSLSFFTPSGVTSSAQQVQVSTLLVTDSVQVTTSGSFRVGLDSLNMSQSIRLDPAGQTFYVRYDPAWSDQMVTESAQLVLTANALTANISLTGMAYGCPAPQSLTLTQDKDTVNISWPEPVLTSNTYKISKDSSNTVLGFNLGTTLPTEAVQRFLPADLTSYHLKRLTQVSFIPLAGLNSCAVRVYVGGSVQNNVLNSGTMILDQQVNVEDLNMGVWNTVDLHDSIVIDATQELWIGVVYQCASGQQSFPFSVQGTLISNENNIVGLHLSSSNTIWSTYNYPAGVMKATIEDESLSVVSYTIQRNNATLGEVTNTYFQDGPISSGYYTYDVLTYWDNGCIVVATDSIEVVPPCLTPVFADLAVTVCNSYTWHGQTYTVSGDYTDTLAAANGCDSIVTLHLTIRHPASSEISMSECGSYTWHGRTYTTSGDYTDTLIAANGCDSIVTLHLTIRHPAYSEISMSECNSYTWHGRTYTTSGDYTDTLVAASGCDSIVTLHLTILHPAYSEISISECNSYTWHGQTYTVSGDYADTLVAANGCDSIVTLHLTVLHPAYSEISVSECGSYTWHGKTYTVSGDYNDTLAAVNGCDSIVTLHLTIRHPAYSELSMSECGSYTWHGRTYTTSGDYTDTLAANGCDSIVTLHLTVLHPAYSEISISECNSYTWHGQTYTVSGDYTDTLIAANGCDSIVTLHLTIRHPAYSEISVSECNSYTWHGTTYTTSGDYTDTLSAANGCDSIVTLHLTIRHPAYSGISVSECGSYTWHGTTYTISGDYTDTLAATNGCDSIVTLHLTIRHPAYSEISVSECNSYTWHGQTYTTSGDYTDTLVAANGCDSIVTLHLTVLHPSYSEISVSECNSYTWHGTTYTTSGDYTDTLAAANGCDSIVTLHLTIRHPAYSEISVSDCNSYTWHGTTYTVSGDYTDTLAAANGCDSIVTLHLTILHPAYSEITISSCNSYTWHGTTYTTSGDYTDTLAAANGCDSIVTLHLTVFPNVVTYDTLLLSVHDLPFTIEPAQIVIESEEPAVTEYQYLLQTVHGCDSMVYLHVRIIDVGVENREPIQLNLYPVPAYSTLCVAHTDLNSIQIYSINGQLLKTRNCMEGEVQMVDVSDLSDGTYLIVARFSDGKTARKLFNVIK